MQYAALLVIEVGTLGCKPRLDRLIAPLMRSNLLHHRRLRILVICRTIERHGASRLVGLKRL